MVNNMVCDLASCRVMNNDGMGMAMMMCRITVMAAARIGNAIDRRQYVLLIGRIGVGLAVPFVAIDLAQIMRISAPGLTTEA